MMVATPAATRPHGWVSGPSAMAYQGDMLSMPLCHLGVFLGFLGLPMRRQWRTAMNNRTAPIRILTASPANDGAVFGLGGLLPVTNTVPATTLAHETIHPNMKAAPLRTPFFDASTRTNPVSGIGSRVITNPMSNRSMITGPCPHRSPWSGCPSQLLPYPSGL